MRSSTRKTLASKKNDKKGASCANFLTSNHSNSSAKNNTQKDSQRLIITKAENNCFVYCPNCHSIPNIRLLEYNKITVNCKCKDSNSDTTSYLKDYLENIPRTIEFPKCEKCIKLNKSKIGNSKCFCVSCSKSEQWLCSDCLKDHDNWLKGHKQLTNGLKINFCENSDCHNEDCYFYCSQCSINLCEKCKQIHLTENKNHKILNMLDLFNETKYMNVNNKINALKIEFKKEKEYRRRVLDDIKKKYDGLIMTLNQQEGIINNYFTVYESLLRMYKETKDYYCFNARNNLEQNTSALEKLGRFMIKKASDFEQGIKDIFKPDGKKFDIKSFTMVSENLVIQGGQTTNNNILPENIDGYDDTEFTIIENSTMGPIMRDFQRDVSNDLSNAFPEMGAYNFNDNDEFNDDEDTKIRRRSSSRHKSKEKDRSGTTKFNLVPTPISKPVDDSKNITPNSNNNDISKNDVVNSNSTFLKAISNITITNRSNYTLKSNFDDFKYTTNTPKNTIQDPKEFKETDSKDSSINKNTSNSKPSSSKELKITYRLPNSSSSNNTSSSINNKDEDVLSPYQKEYLKSFLKNKVDSVTANDYIIECIYKAENNNEHVRLLGDKYNELGKRNCSLYVDGERVEFSKKIIFNKGSYKVNFVIFNGINGMENMFADCKCLIKFKANVKFKELQVFSLKNLFYNCENLTDVDLLSLNTTLVRDMSYMFYNCKNLKNANLFAIQTINVENMEGMFYNCVSMDNFNISCWNTRTVSNMKGMFQNISSSKLDATTIWDTHNIDYKHKKSMYDRIEE